MIYSRTQDWRGWGNLRSTELIDNDPSTSYSVLLFSLCLILIFYFTFDQRVSLILGFPALILRRLEPVSYYISA